MNKTKSLKDDSLLKFAANQERYVDNIQKQRNR